MFIFNLLDLVLIFLIILTIVGLLFNNYKSAGEARIIVYFIYFELIQVLLILILLSGIYIHFQHFPTYLIIALFVVGTAGAETAIIIALFISFVKLSGQTEFSINKMINSKIDTLSNIVDKSLRVKRALH